MKIDQVVISALFFLFWFCSCIFLYRKKNYLPSIIFAFAAGFALCCVLVATKLLIQ